MGIVTDPDAAARLARRYPQKRASRWWVPLALLLAAIGGIWLIWAGVHGATGVVTARVDAFEVRSDTQMDVTVTVDRPDPAKGAECLLYAQAVSYDRVGETTVRLEPGGSALTTLTIELRTFKRATSASIEACRTAN